MRLSVTAAAKSHWHYLAAASLLALLSSCSANRWQSNYGRGDPLTGRIWDVAAGAFIDRPSLIMRLAQAEFVLLGEKHDNPDHHSLQAEVLRDLIAAGRRPAVGFEMFSLDDAGAIANHLARAPNDAAGLGPAVNWQKSGWPDWATYQPIAEAALAANLAIVATNLPLASARKMSRDGVALEPSVQHDLGLDRPLSEALFAAMAADIRNSHCGYGSAEMVRTMVQVQRARDAQMAQSLTAAAGASGAVLVAGAGHVRNDYGIPIYLTAMAPGRRVASIAFVEVAEQKREPRQYLPANSAARAPFDYLWFTPRVDNDDPCEKFQSQLEKFKTAP